MELRSLKQDDSISVDDYGSISDYHGSVLVTSPRSDHPTPTAADDQLPVSLWTKLMSGKLILHLGLLYRDNIIVRAISAMLITTKIAQFAITINSNVCPHVRVPNMLMRNPMHDVIGIFNSEARY